MCITGCAYRLEIIGSHKVQIIRAIRLFCWVELILIKKMCSQGLQKTKFVRVVKI